MIRYFTVPPKYLGHPLTGMSKPARADREAAMTAGNADRLVSRYLPKVLDPSGRRWTWSRSAPVFVSGPGCGPGCLPLGGAATLA